ncbi:tagaturonate reductase [Sphingobacterium shayense]|uniref:tagaturonate reductase n=1 Tax=Sphingobacterium shayense TaxID=626343 RepID=UPI0015565916|nr:tagaturonate reductase [Sphingobacterium shayense]NQD69536.1 tagaturonate reductase [Sphingobacterium shayense]
MLLSKENVEKINVPGIALPAEESFELPERVLQFGTGVLLRGLPDYYIDKANKEGVFNGRVLVVKSTSSQGADAFDKQNCVYTLCIKGIQDGKQVISYNVNNAISRVLAASNDWQEILQSAHNPELTVVLSNTTEVGIVLSNDSVNDEPPVSFPGKLLAFLYERYKYFKGDGDKGLVILPTELITDNATKLKSILLNLAKQNLLGPEFEGWLLQANDFCNTLVDRIVPGKLPLEQQQQTEAELGYNDELMIMAEPFSLWAIETGSARVRERLSFASVDKGIVLVPSIEKFKEIKLRLLNGTHTFSCAAALGSGFQVVKESMSSDTFSVFVKNLMYKEIGPSILDAYIEPSDVTQFASSVIDRFSNPFLDHRWENIAMNYTSKMNMRNVPLLKKWYNKNMASPAYMAFGFAAYIKFMDSSLEEGKYIATFGGQRVVLQDEFASVLHEYWRDSVTVVAKVLREDSLWGMDLTTYPGFEESVTQYLQEINADGVLKTIEKLNIEWQVEY